MIRSDENVPLNIPSDKELGRIYNKNVADYEKKNQQLKRRKPAAEPDVSLAAKFGSDNPGAGRTAEKQANRNTALNQLGRSGERLTTTTNTSMRLPAAKDNAKFKAAEKRKPADAKPAVEPEIYFANLAAKRDADLAAARSARNKKQNKEYLAPTQKDVLPGAKAWSTREKDYSAQAKKQTRAVSKLLKNALYSPLLDGNPELRKSMLAQTSVPWKHTPTTATPHDASMRMPSAKDNAKFKAVDQRLPAAKDNAKFKAVDQRLPAAKDNAKFKAVDTARPGEVDFLGQREAAKKKKRSEALQRWYTDYKKRSLSKK